MIRFRFNYFATWDQYRFGPALELVQALVSEVERDCAKAVAEFDASDDGYVDDSIDPEQGGQFIRVHKGLADNAWDLDDLFRNYFPTLRRSATLGTLCSLLEHELNDLCTTIQRHLKVRISVTDLQGAGIERATKYLKLVGGVDLDSNDVSWAELKKIYALRNAFVHAGGKASKPDVLRYVDDHANLRRSGAEIVIDEGYLSKVLLVMTEYGNVLGDGLRVRFSEDEPSGKI